MQAKVAASLSRQNAQEAKGEARAGASAHSQRAFWRVGRVDEFSLGLTKKTELAKPNPALCAGPLEDNKGRRFEREKKRRIRREERSTRCSSAKSLFSSSQASPPPRAAAQGVCAPSASPCDPPSNPATTTLSLSPATKQSPTPPLERTFAASDLPASLFPGPPNVDLTPLSSTPYPSSSSRPPGGVL